MTITAPEEAGAAMSATPPRENLVRALRSSDAMAVSRAKADGMPTLSGHFAVFDEWSEIDSMWEGHFMERIAPGAFAKTFRENRAQMRVLFQHGQDPQLGDKPLGPIRELREDDTGGYYEVPLLDTSYVREIVPGLEAGLYGASFRFRVIREEIEEEPEPSDANPRGLPERTIREAKVMEFGPVTFPAYPAATAGVRSLTDEYLLARAAASPVDRAVAVASLIGSGKRFDNEDVGVLAQMVALGSDYLDDQDETDDAADISAMEGVIVTLASLLQGETVEVEPPETDDEMGRNEETGGEIAADAPSEEDAARPGTPARSAATPVNEPLYGAERKDEAWRLR